MQVDAEQEVPLVNWVGKCDQLCAQKRISRPEYVFKQDEVTKIFICTITLRDVQVQETGGSKKKAKNAAAKLMYDELQKIKEQDAPPKRSKSKEKLSFERIEDVQTRLTDLLPDDIHNELKLRLNEDHLKHERCSSSLELLSKICSLRENGVLDKMWPYRTWNFYLDNDYLELIDDNYTKPVKNNDTAFRVLLMIRDGMTGETSNVFLGVGKNVRDAKDLAACRAISYVQAKFEIR